MLRVLLVHDHAATRRGLRSALEAHGLVVCAEAGDLGAAEETAARLAPDACLVAAHLPGGAGATTARLLARAPGTRVVVLTNVEDDDELLEVVRAGARGYLSMQTNPARLGHAVEGVCAGESAFHRRSVARLAQALCAPPPRRLPDALRDRGVVLSAREWQVVDGLRDGLSTAQLAVRLGVAPVTIRRYASDVVRKLGVDDRAAALELLDRR